MNVSSPSTYRPAVGDLVQVVGTYQRDMPDSQVGLVLGRAEEAQTIWNVQFTNGATLRIWQGHMVPLDNLLTTSL
jgi:hypothetical protein